MLRNSIKRFAVVLCVLSLCQESAAQGSASLDWLSQNLDYSYFNSDQEKWWVNTFEYNDQGIAHFQNTSAENPNKFSGKTRIDRRVKWIDLDPYSFELQKIRSNKGRIVRGEVLIVHVIDGQRKIGKSLDGRNATPENFLQIAIPQSILDTASHFSDSLKFHLKAAIETNALIEADGSSEDITKVFTLLRGEFVSGSIKRKYELLFDRKIKYEDRLGAKPIRSGFFGFENGTFFEMVLSEEGHSVFNYQKTIDNGRLTLIAEEDPKRKIELPSLHHFQVVEENINLDFKRLSYR